MNNEQLKRAKAAQLELHRICIEAISSGDADRRRVALLLLNRLTPRSKEAGYGWRPTAMYRIKTPEIIQGLLWQCCTRDQDGINYFYFFETWESYFTALVMLDRQRGNYRGALCHN